ncbi:hypothetical protein [Candidatus Protochlamydia amoebophila]|uniref:hypothetical protein n=1 Tax=Candidatus Protochlamydia amoebophila TaxID=362787 RepID=UPI001BCA4282|nr:hypothetical protein [Candidatus Protochlamydia amoebophila]
MATSEDVAILVAVKAINAFDQLEIQFWKTAKIWPSSQFQKQAKFILFWWDKNRKINKFLFSNRSLFSHYSFNPTIQEIDDEGWSPCFLSRPCQSRLLRFSKTNSPSYLAD